MRTRRRSSSGHRGLLKSRLLFLRQSSASGTSSLELKQSWKSCASGFLLESTRHSTDRLYRSRFREKLDMTGGHSATEAKEIASRRRNYIMGWVFDFTDEAKELSGYIAGTAERREVPTVCTFGGLRSDGTTCHALFYRFELVEKVTELSNVAQTNILEAMWATRGGKCRFEYNCTNLVLIFVSLTSRTQLPRLGHQSGQPPSRASDRRFRHWQQPNPHDSFPHPQRAL
jgi:hypothetical protein